MIFFQGTQERVRNSRGNEPSVFEPQKFYCISILAYKKEENASVSFRFRVELTEYNESSTEVSIIILL